MAQEIIQSKPESVGTPPAFKGEGVSIWENKTKNGDTYLSVQLFGKHGIKINCFKYIPKSTI